MALVARRREVRERALERRLDGLGQRRGAGRQARAGRGAGGAAAFAARTQAPRGSRRTGQDMQRGPPRPVPSSLPAMRMTSMPASSSRALVTVLRS